MIDNSKEYVVCASIHIDDGKERVHLPVNIKTGIVVCGLRHHNCFNILAKTDIKYKDFPCVQGFLTSLNRFVDRKEGLAIAKSSNQVSCSDEKVILFSEDIY